MHIIRRLKCFLTFHACPPVVGDSQNQNMNLSLPIIGVLYRDSSKSMYCTLFKRLGSVRFASSAHQGCIYLIKNTVKTVKYYNRNKLHFKIYSIRKQVFLIVMRSWIQHYSSLQCHMIFRNHSNILIYCSRNISDYYQCWKQFEAQYFCKNQNAFLLFRIFWWIEC